jgi:FlgD Ig-like domain
MKGTSLLFAAFLTTVLAATSPSHVEVVGPQWTVRDIDQFQDNFAEVTGPATGTVRADMAANIVPDNQPGIVPGDSTVVTVADPVVGLADDLVLGGTKVYAYVAVWPQGQITKTGANLSGGSRWPFAGTQVIGGVTWTCLRLDSCVVGGNAVPDKFCLDLKDDLFTPGDTICFFYCAENTDEVRTYAFGSDLGAQGDDLNEAAANASEFTCLPAGGWISGGDLLYVDGAGAEAQPYWDTAFQSMTLLCCIDRYDVRGASVGVDNRLASRVKEIDQLLNCYRGIVWDCGDLSITLGDGSGNPEKTDDYGLLLDFLDGHNSPGGVYLCGDDVAEQLTAYSSPSASTFKTFITYTLTTGDHAPTYGTSPIGRGNPTGCLTNLNGDNFTLLIHGGDPMFNDFDVMTPTGDSYMEMGYGAPAANNGAVISNTTMNGNGVDVAVLMSGFSLISIRDDENDGIMDRASYLEPALVCYVEAGTLPQPSDTRAPLPNELSQNYPNPFNPTTTIAFSLKERGHVSLAIYNVAGERVRTLVDENVLAGAHTKVWDGRDEADQAVSSGVYFCRLVAAGFEQTRKMVLLK